MTHTYVILEISQSAYDEIAKKLREAKYDHAFHETAGERDVIDMHGIAVSGDGKAIDRLEEILQEMERYYSESIFPGTSKEVDDEVEKVFPNFVGRNSAAMGRHLAQLIRRKMKETDE